MPATTTSKQKFHKSTQRIFSFNFFFLFSFCVVCVCSFDDDDCCRFRFDGGRETIRDWKCRWRWFVWITIRPRDGKNTLFEPWDRKSFHFWLQWNRIFHKTTIAAIHELSFRSVVGRKTRKTKNPEKTFDCEQMTSMTVYQFNSSSSDNVVLWFPSNVVQRPTMTKRMNICLLICRLRTIQTSYSITIRRHFEFSVFQHHILHIHRPIRRRPRRHHHCHVLEWFFFFLSIPESRELLLTPISVIFCCSRHNANIFDRSSVHPSIVSYLNVSFDEFVIIFPSTLLSSTAEADTREIKNQREIRRDGQRKKSKRRKKKWERLWWRWQRHWRCSSSFGRSFILSPSKEVNFVTFTWHSENGLHRPLTIFHLSVSCILFHMRSNKTFVFCDFHIVTGRTVIQTW